MVLKVRKNDLLYYISIFLVSFFKGFGLGSNDFIYQISMFTAIALCSLKIIIDLKNGIEKEKLVQIFIVICVIMINFFILKDITLPLSIFFFLAIRGTSLYTVLYIVFFSKISSFLINILLVFMNIRDYKIIEFYRNGFIYRNDFGFGHPNTFHYMLASIICLILVLFFKKIKIWHLFTILGINYVFYNFSQSRTGYFNIVLLVVFFFLIKNIKIKRIMYFISKYIQIFLLIFTYILSILLYKVEFVSTINQLLTGRIHYSNLQFQQGISIFGRNFDGFNIIFDNSYSMILTMYGIIISFIFIYLYNKSIKYLIKYNVDSLVLMFLIFSVYMFTESYMVSSVINLTLLVFSKIYFNETEEIVENFVR